MKLEKSFPLKPLSAAGLSSSDDPPFEPELHCRMRLWRRVRHALDHIVATARDFLVIKIGFLSRRFSHD
jgi:hypothetical protein